MLGGAKRVVLIRYETRFEGGMSVVLEFGAVMLYFLFLYLMR